jgi:endonuclease YncB( thermonuclease family)
MIILVTLIASAVAQILPNVPMVCHAPTHYDGDDVHCDDAAWRALANGHGMRLHAINAPELNCAWRRGKPCSTVGGIEARDYLRALTANRSVTCIWAGDRTSTHTGARPVVECSASGVGDIGCAMLASGHAVHEPHFDESGIYLRKCGR